MPSKQVIVVGAGLAGLTCAFELLKRNCKVTVLESRRVLGGRTSSWNDDGMPVESGLHKFVGIYRALPALLEDTGVELRDIITWVDELEIHHPGGPNGRFITAPYHQPIGAASSLVGNNDLLPPGEKAKLTAFGAAGIARCIKDPIEFDKLSVAEYAAEFGISVEVIERVLSTSTQAILFLPADRFSAYAAFAPIVESLKHGLTARLGAFNGGMTEVMINPISNSIRELGGVIRQNARVQSLIVGEGRVSGVRLKQEELRADAVVLAVPLKAAQRLLREPFEKHEWFQPMLRLPSLSAATIQFELTGQLLDSDRTNFSPTSLCCFAEQSRTTFRHAPGRLSAILYPPEEFVAMEPGHVLERVYRDAEALGLPLRERATRCRIVNHPHDFYAMEPGTEALRPTQETPIRGLTLAGDYTKQPFIASMEGAVLSGRFAGEAVQ
jgi:15-cis-phytoene desaturase